MTDKAQGAKGAKGTPQEGAKGAKGTPQGAKGTPQGAKGTPQRVPRGRPKNARILRRIPWAFTILGFLGRPPKALAALILWKARQEALSRDNEFASRDVEAYSPTSKQGWTMTETTTKKDTGEDLPAMSAKDASPQE